MQSEEHYSIDVNLVHAFGSTCSFNYNDAIAICDEETDEAKIMFPAGKAIARKHIDQQHMDFIPFDSTARLTQTTLRPSSASTSCPGARTWPRARNCMEAT